MAKKKDRPVFGNNNSGSKKEQLLEQMKEQQKEAKAKNAEEKWQELLKEMGEEEARRFVQQVDMLALEDSIKAREQEVGEKASELDKKEEALDERDRKQNEAQERLDGRRKELDEREAGLDGRERAVKKQESETDRRSVGLNQREQSILEREMNAENGFARQSSKALEALRGRKEELDAELLDLEKEKIRRENELDQQIITLRAERLNALNQEIERMGGQRRTEIEEEIAQLRKMAEDIIAGQKEALKEQKAQIDADREAVEKQRVWQEQRERDLKRARADLQFEQRDVEEERARIDETVRERIEVEDGEIKRALKQAKSDADSYLKRLKDREERLEVYEAQDREAGGLTRGELIDKLALAEAEIKALKEQRHPDAALHAQYKAKAEDYDRLLKEYEEQQNKLSDLELEKSRWLLTVRQYDLAEQRLRAAEIERAALEASITRCQSEVERLTSLYEKAKNTDTRKAPIEQPHFEPPENILSKELTEAEWLDEIFEKCAASGIKFNKRLLYSFHTALKTSGWSPVTVLAGVSGTGKSLLPLLYSRFGGIYFISMAVQPDWDSPQALFGYFNSVDNKYNPTTLIQSMVQFGTSESAREKETNLSDYMMIVLLDEMNLAHVELYFSDMLSKLEQRRNSGENVMIDIDLGADAPKYQLELNDNILWVGTMNEDETTKSLSDKVLDRGNLISFPRPKSFVSKSQNVLEEAAPMLPKSVWDNWVEANVIDHPAFKERIDAYRIGLEAINKYMGIAGRSLGHRVWQAIENYMGNHPEVIEAVNGDPLDDRACRTAMGKAFEEALVHKVMPKLRGIETEGITRTKCIEPMKDILFGSKGLAKGIENDFRNALENAYETFLWNSAEYLELEE